MSKERWDSQHLKYTKAGWINKPSIFAQSVIGFFPATGKVIDLGCGQGQDSRFFAEHGYHVTGADFSEEAIRIAQEKNKQSNLDFRVLDLANPLPFEDEVFDVVYSHLATHYFDETKTKSLFVELSRVLKKNGVLAILVNSIHDPEYNTGEKIEEDYLDVGGMRKRFFSAKSLKNFVSEFEALVLDEKGETYKDRAIGVSNLVRFIGRKIDLAPTSHHMASQ
ncbi:MAG: class I SAM-dependent methyltransferase [Patescibacteria group bacterium]